jgi:KaiC/GvpD/RAD55 family RecA-like ATPase
MKLWRTGISGLDEFLQGGLPSNVFVLLGPPGSGIEVFARQIAYAGAKQGGVTYCTVTRSADAVREEMAAYGWDVPALEDAEAWKFLSLQHATSLQALVLDEVKQRRRVVVDSLSELLFTHKLEDVIEVVTAMTAQNMEAQELHFLLLTEGMQDPQAETALQHFADGIISFSLRWEAEASSRRLMLKKLRGATVPTRSLPYIIRRNGFMIETAIRIT